MGVPVSPGFRAGEEDTGPCSRKPQSCLPEAHVHTSQKHPWPRYWPLALNKAGRVLGASERCLDPEHVGGGTGSFLYLLIKYAHRKHQLCAALGHKRGRSFIHPSFLQ